MAVLINATTSQGVKIVSDNSGAVKIQKDGSDLFVPNTSGTITVPNGTGTVSVAGLSSNLALQTAQASTSGTNIDFPGVPSWAKRVTIMFSAINAGGGQLQFQLGTGAGPTFTTSGYTNASGFVNQGSSTQNAINSSTGFTVFNNNSYPLTGTLILTNHSSNLWMAMSLTTTGSTTVGLGAGSVSLAAALTAIRMNTTTGATFSAGSVNVMWE